MFSVNSHRTATTSISLVLVTLLTACGSGSSAKNALVDQTPSPTSGSPGSNPAPAMPASQSAGCSVSVNELRNISLNLINQARSQSRMCGNDLFNATANIDLNDNLQAAAEAHSQDMASINFFSHTGSDGSSVAARVDAQNYDWAAVGENIAAGQRTAESAVEGWLASPGHCRNIMNPNYAEIGVACAQSDNSDYGQYWTMVFGAQR